jgi:hypothetical protein
MRRFPPHAGEIAQNGLACTRAYRLRAANQTRMQAQSMHASSLGASGRRTNHAHCFKFNHAQILCLWFAAVYPFLNASGTMSALLKVLYMYSGNLKSFNTISMFL